MPVKPVKPINQRYSQSTKLDASGNGSVEITMRNDFVLQNTRWVIQNGTGTNQATAENFIDSQPWDGTYSGDNDQSGKTRLLTPQNTVTCKWTGGRPGGTATLYLWGLEYPAGEGIPPPASGEGPGNPIVGGQTLIRNAIQSADFVAGSTGWAIMRDGSYEFGSGGIFRGDISVNGTDGSQVNISAEFGTAEIDLQPPSYTPAGVIVSSPAGFNALSNGVGDGSFQTLEVSSGFAHDNNTSANGTEADILLVSSSIDGSLNSEILLIADEIALDAPVINCQGPLTVAGTTIDQLRGNWCAGGTISASNAGVTSGAEVTQITASDKLFNAYTYVAGRLYRVVVMGSSQTTAIGTAPVFSVRKALGAAVRLKFFRTGPSVINNPFGFHFEFLFQVPTNIAAQLVLTLNGSAGQTVTLVASSDNNAQIDIYDAGSASLYSAAYLANLPVLS